MFNFNSTHIFTGYIKELLASFNLPKCRVFVEGQPIIPTQQKTNSDLFCIMPYIKDDLIQYYTKKNNSMNEYEWTTQTGPLAVYQYNYPINNQTINLVIDNNIYDSYTHEYLGNYLRFMRDYNNINLMPLYNCFSDRICTQLDLSFLANSDMKEFKTQDSNYKIYMLPAKLFQKYTIAIDSKFPVELCCGIYGKYFKKIEGLARATYQKINFSQFNRPVLFEKLKNLSKELYIEVAKQEEDLKLFIKLPAENSSSITILEGDYLNYNDSIFKPSDYKAKQNHFVTNFDGLMLESRQDIFRPITNLQLLSLNTGTSYPFADRLIEYLLGQTIDILDENEDNHRRVRTVIGEVDKQILSSPDGFWTDKFRPYLYEYLTNKKAILSSTNHDNLGYVDKDVEKYYKSFIKINNQLQTKNTLRDIDLYPEQTKTINGGN